MRTSMQSNRKAQGRADRMIATARRLGQHLDTANGTLCVMVTADPLTFADLVK